MAAEVTSIAITTYSPAANDDVLQGYYLRDGSVTSMECASTEELIASDNYPFCCTKKSHGVCYQATTCSGNTLIDRDKDTWACEEGTECRPMTIFESYDQSTDAQSWTQFSCFQDYAPNVVYRNFPFTDLATVTTETTSSPTATDTGANLTAPSQTASVPAPTGTESSSSGSSTNTGAIAGGVVGGVAGVALIAAVAFLVLRRRRKKSAELNEIGIEYVTPQEREK